MSCAVEAYKDGRVYFFPTKKQHRLVERVWVWSQTDVLFSCVDRTMYLTLRERFLHLGAQYPSLDLSEGGQ